jgi:hypothetical protein
MTPKTQVRSFPKERCDHAGDKVSARLVRGYVNNHAAESEHELQCVISASGCCQAESGSKLLSSLEENRAEGSHARIDLVRYHRTVPPLTVPRHARISATTGSIKSGERVTSLSGMSRRGKVEDR